MSQMNKHDLNADTSDSDANTFVGCFLFPL